MSTPGSALQRLREESAQLNVLCDEYGVILLTAFGSVLRPAAEPHDLDLGFCSSMGRRTMPSDCGTTSWR